MPLTISLRTFPADLECNAIFLDLRFWTATRANAGAVPTSNNEVLAFLTELASRCWNLLP